MRELFNIPFPTPVKTQYKVGAHQTDVDLNLENYIFIVSMFPRFVCITKNKNGNGEENRVLHWKN